MKTFLGIKLAACVINDQSLKEKVLEIIVRLFFALELAVERATKTAEKVALGDNFEKFKAVTSVIDKIDIASIPELKERKGVWCSALKVDDVPDEDWEWIEKKFGIGLDCLKEKHYKTPLDLAKAVKEYVVGHDKAVEELSIPVFMHNIEVESGIPCSIKLPTLLIGNTGTGKTLIMSTFGRLTNCLVIRVSTSQFVPESWRGVHLTDILGQYVEKFGLEAVKHAILVIDEMDKIYKVSYNNAVTTPENREFKEDSTRELMALFDKDTTLVVPQGGKCCCGQTVQLPVNGMLVLFCGVFEGLSKCVAKRLGMESRVGFGASSSVAKPEEQYDLLLQTTKDDLVAYGMNPELCGRLGDIIVYEPLTCKLMTDILTKAKENPIKNHINYCKSQYNFDLSFEKKAIISIANYAAESGFGVRETNSILGRFMKGIYLEYVFTGKKNSLRISNKMIMEFLNGSCTR